MIAGCSGSDESEGREDGHGDSDGDESSSSDWPMYGVDLQNTGHHPDARGPDGNEVTERPLLDLNGISFDPVCIVDGIAYGHTTAGKIYALNLETEERLWETERTGYPIVFDGMVYGPTTDMRVHGYDTKTGNRWESEKLESVGGLGRPLPTQNGIFVTTSEEVWRINPNTGEYTQVIEIPPYIGGSNDWPAFLDDTLYTVRGSELHALNVETSEIDWTFEPENKGSMIDSNPAIGDGAVYLASRDQNLHAIDIESGEEIWRVDTDTRVEASPSIMDNLVYLSEPNHIIAVDAESGEIEWEQKSLTGTPVDVIVADNTCYAASRFGIWAYDARSGKLDWKYEIPNESDIGFIAPPVVYDGSIYVSSNDETLRVIENV
ncbi:PQQ-binding-like beta-propeller repeat protein [Natronorubrum sp. A-ect3]|uniref:PQQ-binding-like beta-propeller repeat protein n=1 Tax=Natronorubrum sp. A-ect3 TaxID=3242698 RepID=UPI00359D02B2